jgi:hypothetical protein
MTLQEDIKAEYVEKLKDVLGNSGYSTFLSLERKLDT